MPLPVASDILRRLQNTIYQPWEDTPEAATRSSAHNAPSGPSHNNTSTTANTQIDSTTQPSNDLHNFNFGAHSAATSSSPSSHPPQSSSPPFDNVYPRPASELSTRRRQASTSAASAPDVNAQSTLRKRILEIQSLGLPEREKARLAQALMTEAYLEAQRRRRGSQSEQSQQGELTKKDMARTYHDQEHGILGCQHYRRGAKLQCSTCNHWATCRYCHDEEEDHKLIRCLSNPNLTLTLPAGKTPAICFVCIAPLRKRSHNIAKIVKYALRDITARSVIYGTILQQNQYTTALIVVYVVLVRALERTFFTARFGPLDFLDSPFLTCNVCMSMSLQNSHRCIERNTECDCPICGEYLFTSPETVVFMPCGHSIHQRCYNQHIKSSYRCPTCSRALINMDHYFRLLDVEVRRQPMPAPYDSWQTVILCNDCSAKSRVSFHFVGHKCNLCASYNTVMCDILKPPEQVPTAPSQSSAELVSAGPEATASVAAIMDTPPFSEPSNSANGDSLPGRPHSH